MRKQRVLVVDDEPSIRDSMRDILTLEGYEVSLATDGKEAIETYERDRHDVVLLDIRMPGVSGIDALRGIKRVDSASRVIMITGYGGSLAAEAMEAGAEAVFRKPLDVAVFLPVLLSAEEQLHI